MVGYELLDCTFEVRLGCSVVATLCQNARLLGIVRVCNGGHEENGPFPSCCMPQFQSESWCSTIQMEISCLFSCKSNSFPFQ